MLDDPGAGKTYENILLLLVENALNSLILQKRIENSIDLLIFLTGSLHKRRQDITDIIVERQMATMGPELCSHRLGCAGMAQPL